MTNDLIVDAPSELATVNQPRSDIHSLLQLAVEKNIDPTSMSKLYDLHERIVAQQAKEAFRKAMTRFQAECPSVGKDKDGYQGAYRYATLEHIADTIRQPLANAGLSYTFNATQAGDEITTTCTVHHIGGHSEPATFIAAAVGTKMMNVTQMRASALSYGRRYALLMALGIVIREEDDDGQSSAPPEIPDHDQSQPTTQPRGQRVEPSEVVALYRQWQSQMKANELDCSDAAWIALVTRATSLPMESVMKAALWSRDNLKDVAEEMGVPF